MYKSLLQPLSVIEPAMPKAIATVLYSFIQLPPRPYSHPRSMRRVKPVSFKKIAWERLTDWGWEVLLFYQIVPFLLS